MRTSPRIAVVSMALLFAVTGCSKLGANAGATTDAGAGAQTGDVAVVKMQQIATQQAQKPGATAKEVLALVAAAKQIKKVPSDLLVPVSGATDDGPEAGWDGCLAEENATQVKDDCVYGDKNGTKTLVLYGDSHAGMWESAFDVAGK